MKVPPDAALIVVDVQKGHDDPRFGKRNNPDAETRIAELLAAWRGTGRPVIHIQHQSSNESRAFHPRNPGYALKEVALPKSGEPLIQKTASSAFIGTDLESILRSRGVRTVVIVGLTTPHCVSTTARMAGNLGFETFVVSDATAANEGTTDWSWLSDGGKPESDPGLVHAISLATLHGEFATVVNTEAILRSL